MLVCAAVMKADPLNFQRAVGRACDNLIRFLEKSPEPPVSNASTELPTPSTF